MQQLCVRCARQSLLRESSTSRAAGGRSIRRFSISTRWQDDSSDTSMGIGSAAKRGPVRRSPVDLSNLPSDRAPTQRPSTVQPQTSRSTAQASRPAAQVIQRQNSPPQQVSRPVGQFTITRTPVDSPSRTSQPLQPPRGQVLRRAPGRSSAPPPGPLIRRVADPNQRDGPNRFGVQRTGAGARTGGAKTGGARTGGARTGRSNGPPTDKRKRRVAQPDDTANVEISTEEANAFLSKSHTPTEALPYTPKDVTLADLRADWPDTAISPIGMVESVQQRIEHLAHRIPHGYQTPEELAEHFHKGNLTRFESVEERDKVLKLANDLAAKRAEMLTERKSETVAPADMGFADLANSAEKVTLAEKMVRGVYPDLEKQRMPFLDNVAKALRNNETYHEVEATKFMDKIRSLLPQQGAAGRGAQQLRK